MIEEHVFLQHERVKLVEKASTLFERLGSAFEIETVHLNPSILKKRMHHWQQTCAKGDIESFQQRLSWGLLDEARISKALCGAYWTYTERLPSWSDTLNEVLSEFSPHLVESEHLDTDHSDDELPFGEVWYPFYLVAIKKLQSKLGNLENFISGSALDELRNSLLEHLCLLGARTLLFEFSLFRTLRQSPLEAIFSPTRGHSKKLYKLFLSKLFDGDLKKIFLEYAALARLLAEQTDAWVDVILELLLRWEQDIVEIEAYFNEGKPTGKIISISTFLSDPHNGARSVCALTHENGIKLFYKPRDIKLEKVYNQLLTWMNNNEAPTNFLTFLTLDKSDYGWIEAVELKPCPKDKVEILYERAGMLLAIIYMLDGTDCHSENLLVSRDHPVLIDAETLVYPHRRAQVRKDESTASAITYEMIWNSVLSTSLLPTYQQGVNELLEDVGGLSILEEFEQPQERSGWQNINTDQMEFIDTSSISENKKSKKEHLFVENGSQKTKKDPQLKIYENNFFEGFKRLYNFILEKKEALRVGPLLDFHGLRGRFILRHTNSYWQLLLDSLRPELLRDGVDRSIHFDILARAFINQYERHPLFALLAAEQLALSRFDIPYFYTTTESQELELGQSNKIKDCFDESGFQRLVKRLESMTQQDFKRQVEYAKIANFSHFAYLGLSDQEDIQERVFISSILSPQRIEKKQLLARAIDIGNKLQANSIQARDGSASWISFSHIHKTHKVPLIPVNDSLYDGAAGIGLFFSALYSQTQDERWKKLAYSAWSPIRKKIINSKYVNKFITSVGIGGASGLGSIIYALIRSGEFLQDSDFLDSAKLVVDLLIEKHIEIDTQLDVIGGAAGCILGLLSCFKATKYEKALNLAQNCADLLIQKQQISTLGSKSWKTLEGTMYTGFSHGAAGISYALQRLYAVKGGNEILKSSIEGLLFERMLFSDKHKNWLISENELDKSQESYMHVAWCYGASGIGLSRLGALDILDTAEIRKEIESSIQTSVESELGIVDHLCCGNLGRVELLLEAGIYLNNATYIDTAHIFISEMLNNFEKNGYYSLLPGISSDNYNPGFFQGLSGIGYQFLRAANPENMPSVLLWQ